jgi:hypothetical protein
MLAFIAQDERRGSCCNLIVEHLDDDSKMRSWHLASINDADVTLPSATCSMLGALDRHRNCIIHLRALEILVFIGWAIT